MPIKHDFNYQTWNADTILSFLRVPWDAKYQDVCRFANRAALNSWIDSQETPEGRIEKVSYAPVSRPIRVNVSFNKMQKYNYVRARNGAMPIPGGDEQRDWYYFIMDIRYVAPNTTEIIVQLDYFQSYAYDLRITQGFLERGHYLIAANNQFQNYGRDFMAVPEGFEVGSDYRHIAKRTQEIMGLSYDENGTPRQEYDVLVVSTIDLLGEHGDENDPKKPNATGTIFEGLAHGAAFYVFDSPQLFMSWMQNTMKDKPWITQGIISITVVPKLSRYMPGYDYGESGMKHANGYTPFPRLIAFWPNWRYDDEIVNAIPERYRRFAKLKTFPYMAIEITTWSGTPIILKPEAWANGDAVIMERSTFTPPNQRLEFGPRNYNSRAGANVENYAGIPDSVLANLPGGLDGPVAALYRDKGDDTGDYLDLVTRVTSFPTMAILNDAATLYMASNAHGISTSYAQTDWAQRKAMAGINISAANTHRELDAQARQGDLARRSDITATGISNQLASDSWVLNSISGIATGAASGGVGGPAGMATGAGMSAAGAVTSGIATDLNISASNAQMANRLNTSQKAQDISIGTTQYVSDNNRFLGEMIARGDWNMNRQAMMAKIQDAQMLPPSTSGQMGGETMNLVHSTMEISVRWKMIDETHIATIGEFWFRYGYAVEKFIRGFPEDMHVMSKFTYYKLTETMTNNAPVPETARDMFRAIHEKGVTYWRRPEDIGNIDYADNFPIEGITI